ncbi:alpha/beta fold hydrolase [Devosia sp.]|uniref:alpha/beta fold hydrolase n=1 Tax=Devosia sp. TaxID=1871048 RepID=UPI003A94185B
MLHPHPFPQPSRVAVNGVELEVFEAGRENAGRPIVLCHGWPELAYSWRHQIPALVAAGYHVIAPNQRGFGQSSRPDSVTDYDIAHLTGDLVALLDHYGYADATFVGHDWGAMVVWGLALLHPDRVNGVINLSVPYQPRGEQPWIEWMEQAFGPDYYFVHFNRQPGVADAILDTHAARFLTNLYRKNLPVAQPEPGMAMINLAMSEAPQGDPLLTPAEIETFITAFQDSGFTGGINWYRNLDRNWHLLGAVDAVIRHPALMIYGAKDVVPPLPQLSDFVPDVETVTLECGHWIQQEQPEATNHAILQWLARQHAG